MKKAFLPLLAALALSASAQVPTTFNYQGVSAYQSAEITVSFEVLDAEGYTVYQEDQQVTTNDKGVYTAVIGAGEATRGTWEAVNWAEGGYSIATYINGVNVSVAPLQAVPYANVASSLTGAAWDEVDYLATTVDDLVMTNRKTQTDLAELRLDVNTALEFANTAGTIATTGYEELQDLKEVVDNATSDVQGLQEAMRGKADVAHVAAVEEAVEANTANIQALAKFQQNFDETYLTAIDEALTEVTAKADALQAQVDASLETLQDLLAEDGLLTTTLAAHEEAIANVTSDVQGLSEKMRGLATVEALAELEAAQDAYDRDLQETLKESFGAVSDELEGLHAQVDGAYEILNDLLSEDGLLNTTLAAQEEAIANVTSDVQGLSEKMRGLATVEALAELEAAQDAYDRDLQETLQESFGAVSDELEGLHAQVDGAYEILNDLLAEDGLLNTTLAEQQQAIDYVTSDVQGLSEAMRGKANVEDVVAVNEDLEVLKAKLAVLQSDVADVMIANGVNATDLAKLVITVAELKDAVAELQAK